MRRLLLLLAVCFTWSTGAFAQCTGPGGVNTIATCQAAVSLQLSDLLFGYQLGQSPSTRKVTAAQVLGLLSAGSGVSLDTVGNAVVISAPGTVSITGSPANGNLTAFSGAGSITNGDLSGDVTTAGSLGTTVGKVNGVAYPALPSANTLPVVTGLNTITYEPVPNAALANAATTVNGQTCTLGSTCTITATAGSVTVGTTTITGGTTTRVLFDNAGVLGEYSVSGSGNVALTTSPSFTTPALGTPSSGVLTNATGLPLGGLVAQSANTVVANVTAGSASPTAASLPSCVDSAGNHLNYTNGTGFSCGTSSSGGGGSVTSITLATPSSTLSLGGTNPVTTSGTINADINLSHANTWAAAQTFTNSDLLLLGSSTGATTFTSANAGASNFTLTVPARTATLGTTTGTLTSGNCVKFDASGNSIDAGAPCGTGSGTVTAVSVASANGFAGSSSGGATPALTLSTSITGALKGNGTAISQAACSDLSNGATGCSTATGTSGATIPLLNGTNVWSGQQSASITSLTISTATFTPTGANNDYTLTLVHASCPCTLANPSATPVAGTSGVIIVKQSATGSDLISTWGSQYQAAGGTASIVLSTAANATDVLSYFVLDSTHILLLPAYNFSH